VGEPRPVAVAVVVAAVAAAPAASSVAAPRPVAVPAALAPSAVARLCDRPSRWWLAAVARWPGRTVHTRDQLAAVAAAGPLDPAIPFVTIHSARVAAIGYCAPALGTDRPPDDARVAVWRIDSRSAVQIQPPTMRAMDGTVLGRLWEPPSGPVATLRPADARTPGAGTWPTGRYVIAVEGGAGTYSRWLGVEVVLGGAQ
jgi:hypothetical protein